LHEHALIDDLLRKIESVAATERSSRVSRIRVELGALSHLTPEHFMEHFEQAAAGTVAEGAEVVINARDDPLEPAADQIILTSVDIEA
jgi:hydrogenase nickel incorporation protein HypA/HybF